MFSTLHILRKLLLIAVAATVLGFGGLIATTQSASASSDWASCYGLFQGQMLYLVDTKFESCAKMVQAAKSFGDEFGVGIWNGCMIAVQRYGDVYYTCDQSGQWYYAGSIQTTNLMDRCWNGDIDACNTYQRNIDFAIDSLNRLYPNGWSQ